MGIGKVYRIPLLLYFAPACFTVLKAFMMMSMKKTFSSRTVTAVLLGAFLLGSGVQGLLCPRQAARAGKAVVQGGGIFRPEIGAASAGSAAAEGKGAPACRNLPAHPAEASAASASGPDRLHPFPPALASLFSPALLFSARTRSGRIAPAPPRPDPRLAHIRTVVLLN